MSKNEVTYITLIKTRTLVAVVVNGVTHALPAGCDDCHVFSAVEPFLPFNEYVLDYAGSLDETTVFVERIRSDEPISAASERVAKKVRAFNEALDLKSRTEDTRPSGPEAIVTTRETRFEPEPGTYAFTARALVDMGIMSGDEADAWKDEMKDCEDES